jgi:hypothetical protein
MNPLKKEFVPYEQALALKELGFDELYLGAYYHATKEFTVCDYKVHHARGEHTVLAPLKQQAFKWFREKYNIDAWVQPFVAQSKKNISYLPDESYGYFIFKDGVFVWDKVDLLEPEEAELACLKKLIEIAKNK